MSYPKYSPVVARWSLLKGTTDKRYRRNVKILLARGLRPELARAAAGKICRGEIENHSAYVDKLLNQLDNYDVEFLIHTGAFNSPQMTDEEKEKHLQFMLEMYREEEEITDSFKERTKRRRVEKARA